LTPPVSARHFIGPFPPFLLDLAPADLTLGSEIDGPTSLFPRLPPPPYDSWAFIESQSVDPTGVDSLCPYVTLYFFCFFFFCSFFPSLQWSVSVPPYRDDRLLSSFSKC